MSHEKREPGSLANKRMSRRKFLTGAVGGAAAVAAVAAAGKVLPTVAAQSPSSSGAALQPTASTGVPSSWDSVTDVVVVGSGVAGHAAAITAYDNGASVAIVEKETQYFGGNSILAGGNMQFPVNFVSQAAGIEDHVQWAIEDYLINGGYRNNVDLLKVFCENANDTAMWLQNLGIVWAAPTQQGDDRVARVLHPAASPNYPGSAGISEIYVMNQALAKRGITVQLGKKMVQIYRQSLSGLVVGIQVQDATTGDLLNYGANKAVVLATGGFKANPQMIRSWHPLLDEINAWSGHPITHTTGDGHVAALQVGAGEVDTSWPISFLNSWGTSYGGLNSVWNPIPINTTNVASIPIPASSGVSYPAQNAWAILVAGDGNRFMNEATWGEPGTPPGANDAQVYSVYMQAYLQIPFRPRNVWAIVDAAGAKALTWNLSEFQSATTPDVSPYLDQAYVGWSNTVSGLADQMGISETNLEAAIAKWNGYVASGTDGDFGRPAPLNPISTAPFMAAKLNVCGHDQSGGIRVNTKAQVIDCQNYQVAQGSGASASLETEAVIPHLYGCGEFAGGFWGMARGDGKMGSYTVIGRVAGQNAAAEQGLGLSS